MEKKTTKVQIFTQILEKYPLTDEESNALKHEIEMINKRAEARKGKPSAKQIENGNLADKIYNIMVDGKAYNYAELKTKVPEIAELSPQKITAIISPKIKAHAIERVKIKGMSCFKKI